MVWCWYLKTLISAKTGRIFDYGFADMNIFCKFAPKISEVKNKQKTMIPTNYHLFDFMDFDAELSKNESLWKACKPVAVYERGGDVCIDVPFQKQMLSNDMAADESAARRSEEHTSELQSRE